MYDAAAAGSHGSLVITIVKVRVTLPPCIVPLRSPSTTFVASTSTLALPHFPFPRRVHFCQFAAHNPTCTGPQQLVLTGPSVLTGPPSLCVAGGRPGAVVGASARHGVRVPGGFRLDGDGQRRGGYGLPPRHLPLLLRHVRALPAGHVLQRLRDGAVHRVCARLLRTRRRRAHVHLLRQGRVPRRLR